MKMLYELYVIKKICNKSISDALLCSCKVKIGKKIYSKKLFKLFLRNFNYICNNKMKIVKKYNLECLQKALVVFYLASISGVDATFYMGFHHVPTLSKHRTLAGHAWIKSNDIIYGDNGKLNKYIVTTEFKNFIN